jgi:two-component system cell cycle sensor histidine kinase/response regulator CckA
VQREWHVTSNFFLEKKPTEENTSSTARAFVIAFVTIIYAGLAVAVGYVLQMQGFTIITGIALYSFGLIGGLGALILKKIYADSEQNRKMLIEILEGGKNARLITDQEFNTSYSNSSFNDLTISQGKPSLESFIQLFEHSQKTRRQLEKAASNAIKGKIEELDLQTEIKNKKHYFKVTAQPVKGWADYIHWRIDDISDKHQMEKAIHDEKEKLIDFTDSAPVGFFSVDKDGVFQFINQTFADWIGLPIEDIVQKAKLHDYVAKPPQGVEPYDLLQDDDHHQIGEILMKAPNGREFMASINHLVIADVKGEIRTRSVIYDLTEEQNIEAALKQSEDRFERLFEQAPVGICLLKENGELAECNNAFINMIGQPEKMIVGKPLFSFLTKKYHDTVKEWTQRIFKEEKAYSFIEVTLKTAQQDVIVQLYGKKFQGQNRIVLHCIDLTEFKTLEQQFTQSQKMQAIGQLAGGVAHDFNNLLTAMIGFCDLLLLRHKPGDSSFGDIMQIKQNANRAANLVRQLLAFSRQQTLQPRILDMTDILTELSHLIRRLIGANIDLQIEHESDLGLVKVDQGQLEQVLINLAVNARDAMADGGELTIKTANFSNKTEIKLKGEDRLPSGEWVAVSVQDSGTGIETQHLARIFEPFFSTKEVGAGTGLGLSTVHGIVHQTGGAISVDSTVGKGTSFTVYLPRHYEEDQEAKEDTTETEEPAPDLTGTAKILLVEDEDAVRTFSARALSNKGYQILEAASGKQALDIIAEQKPELELVITDVVMPEMDGPTMAKELRKEYKDVKIIFISGYAEDRFKEELGDDVWFLPKPFTLKQLATKVKEVLEE